MQSRGETGLETLIDSGLVGETSHFPELMTWADTLAALNSLLTEEHNFKTLVLDTINGFERLCHEHVCNRDFNGDFGEKGFLGYMRGFEVALADWREFLDLLDRIRADRKVWILCLCHTKVGPFKNPEGADYDRYEPDMHRKTWGLTHKWADMVLFGNFEVIVDEKKRKAKSGGIRMLYPERTAAYDAKNRLGLTDPISMGESGADAWANLSASIKDAKKRNTGQ